MTNKAMIDTWWHMKCVLGETVKRWFAMLWGQGRRAVFHASKMQVKNSKMMGLIYVVQPVADVQWWRNYSWPNLIFSVFTFDFSSRVLPAGILGAPVSSCPWKKTKQKSSLYNRRVEWRNGQQSPSISHPEKIMSSSQQCYSAIVACIVVLFSIICIALFLTFPIGSAI